MEVPKALKREVKALIKEYSSDQKRAEKLNTEKGFHEYCIDELNHHGPAITRESTYGNARTTRMVMTGRWCDVDDPPVIMRGSRWLLHRKYAKGYYSSCSNGWKEHVIERYFRMKKVTAISRDDLKEIAKTIMQSDKHCASLPEVGLCRDRSCGDVYINGKSYFVHGENWPAVKALRRQLKKVTNLETVMSRIAEAH